MNGFNAEALDLYKKKYAQYKELYWKEYEKKYGKGGAGGGTGGGEAAGGGVGGQAAGGKSALPTTGGTVPTNPVLSKSLTEILTTKNYRDVITNSLYTQWKQNTTAKTFHKYLERAVGTNVASALETTPKWFVVLAFSYIINLCSARDTSSPLWMALAGVSFIGLLLHAQSLLCTSSIGSVIVDLVWTGVYSTALAAYFMSKPGTKDENMPMRATRAIGKILFFASSLFIICAAAVFVPTWFHSFSTTVVTLFSKFV